MYLVTRKHGNVLMQVPKQNRKRILDDGPVED